MGSGSPAAPNRVPISLPAENALTHRLISDVIADEALVAHDAVRAGCHIFANLLPIDWRARCSDSQRAFFVLPPAVAYPQAGAPPANAESVARGRCRRGSTSRHSQMTGNRGCTKSSRILDCLLTSLPEARARHFRAIVSPPLPALVY